MKLPALYAFVTLSVIDPTVVLHGKDTPPGPDYEDAARNQAALKKWWVGIGAGPHFLTKAELKAFDLGDFTLLDRLAADRNFKELFNHLLQTMSASYGEAIYPIPLPDDPFIKSDRYELNTRFGAKVREQVRQRISSIPGHTNFLVEGIEESSKLLGGDRLRSSNINLLGTIGSMEAIQQLGRFLFDDRNLEGPDFYPDDACGVNPRPQPNSSLAARSLRNSLGDAAPPPHNMLDVQAMRAWWQEEAGRPYREWNYEDYEPMPPPRKRAVSLRPPGAKSLPPSGNPGAASSLNLPAIWPVLVIFTLAALAAVLGFTKLRRG
ncbi:MAG: hypothetical protein JNN17_21850 [Verrucomicrobiaceae bacterium]|jgi:hypothetical protein|nr:hypothetical protein [Verrucomicrobiaceae bacterium]